MGSRAARFRWSHSDRLDRPRPHRPNMDPSLGAAPGNTAQDSPSPGVFCSNPNCRTRAGERSRGHQSCRSLLCGHCCQNAAREAAAAGEHRPVCKVHARRVHTGHKAAPKVERQSTSEPSSAPPATTNNTSPCMSMVPKTTSEPEELHDLLDKRARLEQSLKRSLTMVIWYRNGCEPLRIAHEVSTFPLFQLQDFPELIGELGLQPSSYIDSYNNETGQWEQHKTSTVRSVEQEQRLLYRLRPSLLDSLTDCPSLDQELSLQPPPKTSLAKRQPEPPVPLPASSKQVRLLSNSTPVRTPTSASPQNSVLQNLASSTGSPLPIQGTSWSLTPFTSAGAEAPRTTQVISAPSNSSPSNAGSIKRWPTDYSVHEIVEGFDAMASLMKSDQSIRQKHAFEQVFPPCRYVKSTVGRAKLYWKRASQEIRDHFLGLPRDDQRGKWTNFVHLMDGRLVIEVGKEKTGAGASGGAGGLNAGHGGVGIGDESMVDPNVGANDMDTDAEDDRVSSPLGFANAVPTKPRINIQSPATLTAHASLPLVGPPGPPPMGGLLPNPTHQSHSAHSGHVSHASPLTHHASAPAISMTTAYGLDRSLSLNHSSSSLSGAITIPEA